MHREAVFQIALRLLYFMGMMAGEVQAQIRAWGPDTFGARVLSFDAATVMQTPGELAASGRRPVDLGALVGF